MSESSIARLTPDPIPVQLSASDVERAAQRVAVALGLLHLDDPLVTLSDWRCRVIRFCVRMILHERTWDDAELWSRDYYAQNCYGKSFYHLPFDQQKQAAQVVQQMTSGCELYLEGYPESLNEWTRNAAKLGARPTDPALLMARPQGPVQ